MFNLTEYVLSDMFEEWGRQYLKSITPKGLI